MTKKFILELTELDMTILLEALALKEMHQRDSRLSTKAVRFLTDRVYRAMGIRMDK